MKKKQLIQTGIKFAISIALIVWILRGANLSEVFAIIGSANVFALLFAFLFKLSGYYISAVRWQILLKAQGAFATIPFLISSYWVGFFFNNILPSSIGGDVVRIYDSWRSGTNRPTAVTVVFVDRFLGTLALVLIALGVLLVPSRLTEGLPLSRLGIFLLMIGMIVLCWLIFVAPRSLSKIVARFNWPLLQKINSILAKIADAFEIFQRQKHSLIKGFFLSFALQINVIIYHYIVVTALNLPVPFYSFFVTIPIITLITTLPISINGIGVRENLFIFFFALFAVPREESIAYSWLLYGILLVQGLIGGLVYAFRRESSFKMKENPVLETERDA